MMVEEIHKNDVGTKFLVTVMDGTSAVDISLASAKKIILKGKVSKGGNGAIEYDAIFETDGTDGKIYYITVADDLATVGSWSIQAKVTLPAGVWSSSVHDFLVYDNL